MPIPPEEESNSASEQNQKDMQDKVEKLEKNFDELTEENRKTLEELGASNSETLNNHLKQFIKKGFREELEEEQKRKDSGEDVGPSR